MTESLATLVLVLNSLSLTLTAYAAQLEETPEALTRRAFSDSPVMVKIIECESGFRQFDSTGAVLRGKINSKDTGLAQINERYHLAEAKRLGIDIYSTEGNLEYARLLYEKEGTRPWRASSSCWSPKGKT